VGKSFIYGIIVDSSFQLNDLISQSTSLISSLTYSREQAIILMNFILFHETINIQSNFYELLRIFPFTHSHFLDHIRLTDETGSFLGVRKGQGSAYSFPLFFTATYGAGIIFLFIATFLVSISRNSILILLSYNIFFSVLRNAPYYWSSQIKLFM